jgi:DNA-binding transcriptional MerR regulator
MTIAAQLSKMPNAKKKTKSSVDDIVIPDKLYFRIGEVSELAGLPAYVLRFWETEFPQLKPTKSGTGQRMYRRRDVENLLLVKKLLYEEGYTIAGARDKLKQESKPKKAQTTLPFAAPVAVNQGELKRVRHELRELLQLLKMKPRAKK